MKALPVTLPDGRTLQQRRGRWILQPDGVTVAVQQDGGSVTVTDPDTGDLVYAGPLASGEAQASVQPAKATSSGKPAAGRHGDRWAAYNAFVDVISPRLSLAQRAVWHVMFRHARDWTVSTSARRLAIAVGIDKGTASEAIRRLEKAGLVRCSWKSTDKSEASRYSINPRPANCLAGLVKSSTSKP